MDRVVERRVAQSGRAKLARLAAQLALDLLEDLARGVALAGERNFRSREQLRLVVVQVARDSGALLVDGGEHSQREGAHKRPGGRPPALPTPRGGRGGGSRATIASALAAEARASREPSAIAPVSNGRHT